MKTVIRPLPEGTVISYLDVEAVVVEDRGEMLSVTVDEIPELWYWEHYEVECRVVSYPTDEK